MAMFSAYFDASGQDSDPFFVVAGYVANFGQWQWFESIWREQHRAFNVELPFHMVDFAAACKNPERYAKQRHARQDYVRIASDAINANRFLRSLAIAQATLVHCGISCIIPMNLYNGVSSLLDLRQVVPPYALGARMCIEQLRQWENKFAIGEPTECIFESGDFGQGKFIDLMVDEEQALPIFKKKSEFAGLQAADYYAWQQFGVLKGIQRDPNYVARDEVSMLIWGIPKLHFRPNLTTLIKVCEAKGIDPRTGVQK